MNVVGLAHLATVHHLAAPHIDWTSLSPLVVLTAGNHGLPLKRPQAMEAAWRGMQEEMAGLSTDSVHVLMPKSGHYIQLESPKAVIAAIQEVVTAVRTQGRLPACTTTFPALGGTCFPAL